MSNIAIEATHDVRPGQGASLLTQLTRRLTQAADRNETTLTVKFSKHEVEDLAFRARSLEGFGPEAIIPKQFEGRVFTDLSDVSAEDCLTVLVYNAVLAVRGITTAEAAEPIRYWKGHEQDGGRLCISVVLPAAAAIVRRPQPMRSG